MRKDVYGLVRAIAKAGGGIIVGHPTLTQSQIMLTQLFCLLSETQAAWPTADETV